MDRDTTTNTTTTNTTATDNTRHECGLSSSAVAWVQEHGSEYLRLRVEKGDFCSFRYNVERAKLEAPPGWSLLDEGTYPSSNPPEEAMDLLFRARERFPTARLRQIYRDHCVEYVVVVDAPWPDGWSIVSNDHVIVVDDDDC